VRYDQKCIGLCVKYLLFLSDFNETQIFLTDFKISNFMKIHPVGAKLFHVNRQTDSQADMMKLRVAFCDFVNVPKRIKYFSHIALK
jgi:hypothetical protein